MWNSRALLHGLGLVALSSLGLGSCGGDVGIVVSVENWPSTSPYLLVDTQVNGTSGQQLRIPAGQNRFVVRLPSDQTGDLTLSYRRYRLQGGEWTTLVHSEWWTAAHRRRNINPKHTRARSVQAVRTNQFRNGKRGLNTARSHLRWFYL